MNRDIAQRWVDALESGEFAQTTRRLRRPGGYCCLGVLCEVYRRDTGDGAWGDWNPETEDETRCAPFLIDGRIAAASILPRRIEEWLAPEPKLQGYLTAMNDSGEPFSKIAAEIRRRAGLPPRTPE